jgi:hypothetical protein
MAPIKGLSLGIRAIISFSGNSFSVGIAAFGLNNFADSAR